MKFLTFIFLLLSVAVFPCAAAATDYSAVDAIFSKYCLDCHASQDPDAKLVLESYDTLMKGSENGPVVTPGNCAKSSLAGAIEGTLVKNGKRIIMPPGKKRAKLQTAEIAVIKNWITAGARAPAVAKSIVTELDVPKIPVDGTARNPINALARVPGTNRIAVARYRQVEIRSSRGAGPLIRTLAGHHGNVNSLAFSSD
jgi:cytochrome c551/c552